jgi:hypothetical protein
VPAEALVIRTSVNAITGRLKLKLDNDSLVDIVSTSLERRA